MAFQSICVALLALPTTTAFPFIARAPGVDSSLLRTRAGSAQCPNVLTEVPAAPITATYPYNGARGGLPGLGIGGYLVPAPGDTAHEYRAPTAQDIRGPCPGLNTMANHGFIARNGVTNMTELIDAQQNVFNVGWDLALVLAIAGVATDGDFLGSGRLSIGCDASAVTSLSGMDNPGLDQHNTFEADVSLTRNDYNLSPIGDNFRYNNSLFTQMMQTCAGNCNVHTLGLYRFNRWQQSKHDNGNFSFSVGQVLLYGAASFLYELFPTANETGIGSEYTEMSLFGASKKPDGSYYFNGGERLPPAWRTRVVPFNSALALPEILKMYLPYPVPFGMNMGPNNFFPIDWTPYIKDGLLTAKTPSDLACMFKTMLEAGWPMPNGQMTSLTLAVKSVVLDKVGPILANLITAGCPT